MPQKHPRFSEITPAEFNTDSQLDHSHFGQDYAYIHVDDFDSFGRVLRYPVRSECITIILCLEGDMTIDINTTAYNVGANTLISATMGHIIAPLSASSPQFSANILLISREFLSSLNFDINVLSSVNFDPGQPPILKISPKEMNLLKAYFDLMHYNTVENTDAIFVRSISRNLFAAAIYQTLQLVSKYQSEQNQRPTADAARNSRCHNYVRDFMHLVLMHHREQRCVAFYAEKLFLSPKYLSHIMKEMTGRSAAEWIDHHVILEAKNLLRYSGKNVQQIAYDLNFPNQSAFGKYFKHLTGLSPTQFQRS